MHHNGSRKDIAIHIEDVYKCYGKKTILDNIDFSLRDGELCTVVGPSGCGKSTLLKIILGEEPATKGTVLIHGRDVGFPDPVRGVVFQKYPLYPHLSALNNIMSGKCWSSGWIQNHRKKKEYREEAMHFVQKMQLEEHWQKFPHELSGGQQQRVALAQALIMHPKILLMDEPFGALDPGTRERMQIFLLELWEEYKMTIFFVTHDLEEAVFLGTRIIVLSQYYTDARGDDCLNRGAKIVLDCKLPRVASSTGVKESAEFGKLIQEIRQEAFQPKHRKHVEEFNLKHPDSFQTLRDEESIANSPF